MAMSKCPGQNTQYWGFDSIFEIPCPKCGHPIEFFRDEVRRRCKVCGEIVFNDRMDLGCAKWCPAAASCIGAENFKALELSEKIKSRREDFHLLLDQVPVENEKTRDLFKILYSEHSGEDRLFDKNRLYTIKENDPSLFDSAIKAYQSFLTAKENIAKREAAAAARTREILNGKILGKSRSKKGNA
jgi:ribosomal protein S27E